MRWSTASPVPNISTLTLSSSGASSTIMWLPKYKSVSSVSTPANTLRKLVRPYTRSRSETSLNISLLSPSVISLRVMRPPPSGLSVMRSDLSSLMSPCRIGIPSDLHQAEGNQVGVRSVGVGVAEHRRRLERYCSRAAPGHLEYAPVVAESHG